jgi:hypothetical protein
VIISGGGLQAGPMLLPESLIWGQTVCWLMLMVCETLWCDMRLGDMLMLNLMLRCGVMLLFVRNGVHGNARCVPRGHLTDLQRHRRGRGIRDRLPERQSSGRREGRDWTRREVGLGDGLHSGGL